ncbi:MAG: hypothetical protein FWE68_05555, partial [Defluviitaleaceae bacterium]|nr:hypothetical protein [Defluviitaleaceae bacterium]
MGFLFGSSNRIEELERNLAQANEKLAEYDEAADKAELTAKMLRGCISDMSACFAAFASGDFDAGLGASAPAEA